MNNLLYRVTSPFSVYNTEEDIDNRCKPAPGQIISFKTGDVIKADKMVDGSTVSISYKCDSMFKGNIGAFFCCQSAEVYIPNYLEPVKKCASGFSRYDDEQCINPLAAVIDNKASRKVLGMHPVLGYSVIAAGAAGLIWGIVKISSRQAA